MCSQNSRCYATLFYKLLREIREKEKVVLKYENLKDFKLDLKNIVWVKITLY